MVRKFQIAFLLLSLLLVVTTLFAHEYILLASRFKLNNGDTLELHLFVADGFNIEAERSFQTNITKRFELLTNSGVTDLRKNRLDNQLPLATVAVNFNGLGLFCLDRDYARISLDPKKFREYLKEDHIENISISASETKYQHERYSRFIKCLVQSDKLAGDTLYKVVTGQQFEFILLQNPYTLKPGDHLQVQVLFKGKPLTGKIITARNRTGSAAAIVETSRTNNHGICSFNITRRGSWFIHATHMIACPEKTEADWESFWASYSFGII